jgi:hypothetical protein
MRANGLIAGELGFNYYNNSLWVGPENDKDGKGYSILVNRDRRITSAIWNSGTSLGPKLKFTEYDQEGYLRQFESGTIPIADTDSSGVVNVGVQNFSGIKIFAHNDEIKIPTIFGEMPASIAALDGIVVASEDGLSDENCNFSLQIPQGFGAMTQSPSNWLGIGLVCASTVPVFGNAPEGFATTGTLFSLLGNRWKAPEANKIAAWIKEDPDDIDSGEYLGYISAQDLIAAGISTSAGLTQNGNIIQHSDSVTPGTISGTSSTGLSFGSEVKIPSITYNSTGHITGATTTSIKLPSITAEAADTSTAAKLVTAVALSAAGKLTTTTFNGNVGAEDTFVYLNGGVPTATAKTFGSKTKPVYINAGKITAGSTYAGATHVTLNGTSKGASKASFYAPTTAGTAANQLLVWDSENAVPIWKAQSELDGFLESIAFGGDGRTLTLTLANGTPLTATIPATITGFTSITSNNFIGALTGNADTATKAGQFSSAASVALTGDVTGSASSTKGWSIATTLANSGVTAGAYGPTASISPGFGGSYNVPYVKVDAKGRVTEAATYSITLPSLTSTSSNDSTAAALVKSVSLSSTGTLTVKKYNGTKGSATKPIYLNSGVPTEGNLYAGGTKVTLNGTDLASNTANFYAPASGGTSGQILQSKGTAAPAWVNTSSITAGKATADASGNTITSTYETKSDAASKLATAKSFATTEANRVKSEILDGADEAFDTLVELKGFIDENGDIISALDATVGTKADKAITITAGAGLTGGGDLSANRTIAHSNSVTAKTSGTQAAATVPFAGSFKITEPKYDAQGHITGLHQVNITLPSVGTVSGDGISLLSYSYGGSGTLLNLSASHEKMWQYPSSGNEPYQTAASAATTISGAGTSKAIKIPKLTVDDYGHVIYASDESVTVTLPSISGGVSAANCKLVSSVSASGSTVSATQKTLAGGTNITVSDSNSTITVGLSGVVAVANGGTGNGTQTASRLIYSESASKLSSSNHYSTSSQLFVNSTTADTKYTFKVNGASGFTSGHVYLTGASASSSTASTTQLVFGTPGGENNANNHIVLSSNKGALVINPTINSTDGQIVFYLGKQSSIPSGVSAGASSFTSISTPSLSATAASITTVTGALKGNADTASKWATARKLTLNGDVSGSATFDGSGDITLTTTVADDSHKHTAGSSWSNRTLTVSAGGNSTSSTIPDTLTGFKSVSSTTFVGALSGNATSASKWATARTIALGGDASGSVTFDGSADATLTVTVLDDSHKHTAGSSWSNRTLTVSAGGNSTSSTIPTTLTGFTSISSTGFTGELTGNASTATKLKTARTISLSGSITGSASFDGSGNITIATTTNHTHSYLPLAGGSVTGDTNIRNVQFMQKTVTAGTTSGVQNTLYIWGNTYGNTASDIKTAGKLSFGDPGPQIVFGTSAGNTSGQRLALIYTDNDTIHTGNSLSLVSTETNCAFIAPKVYGAVWNDYAEYRTQKESVEPGYCVTSNDKGQVSKTTRKYQVCDGIVSDTFGFAIGETEECKTPLAVSGRVLAYCEGNRYDYHAGDTVCAGPNGKVVKMTREEVREWPDRIVGTVSEIPEYETWGTGNVKVNGRIWIKVK